MHIVSTNVGQAKTVTYKGKEYSTGIYKFPVETPVFLGTEDVAGDSVVDRKHHGGLDKACYLYSANHYSFWKQQYPDIDWQWGMFGENLTIEGLDESEVFIGDVFKIGSAIVQVSQPRQPCFKLGVRFGDGAMVKRFIRAELPGIYLRVLTEGTVKVGDRLLPLSSGETEFSVKDVFRAIYDDNLNSEMVKRLVKIPELADSCRKAIGRKLEPNP